MANSRTIEQQSALATYHQTRAQYRAKLSAAKRLVGIGADETLDRFSETTFEARRRASINGLVHEAALALSEAYSRARSLGCFERGIHNAEN